MRQELPQREGIGQAPGDAAFAIETFEEADHHDAEILARRQRRTSEFLVIETGAGWFRRMSRTWRCRELR